MEVLFLGLMSLKLLLEKGIETMVDVEKMIEDNERLVRKIAHFLRGSISSRTYVCMEERI